MATSYHLADEPHPSTLNRFAVQPFWPLLGTMLGGVWLAWPWFALNSFAVGSPTQRRELLWLGIGVAGALLLTVILVALYQQEVVSLTVARYALLGLTVWKLGVSYTVFMLQGRTFQIYEYYGGEVKNGLVVLLLAYLVGRPTVLRLFSEFWLLVLQ